MTITPWTMYWLTRIGDIRDFFQGAGMLLCIFGGTACIILTGIILFDTDKCCDIPRKYLWVWLIPFCGFVSLVIFTLIPTEKDIATIIVIPKIVNNEKVQQIPSKILDLATDWLDALKPKK